MYATLDLVNQLHLAPKNAHLEHPQNSLEPCWAVWNTRQPPFGLECRHLLVWGRLDSWRVVNQLWLAGRQLTLEPSQPIIFSRAIGDYNWDETRLLAKQFIDRHPKDISQEPSWPSSTEPYQVDDVQSRMQAFLHASGSGSTSDWTTAKDPCPVSAYLALASFIFRSPFTGIRSMQNNRERPTAWCCVDH